MNGIINRYRSELDVIGLNLQENGTLEIDTNELKQAALSQYAKEDFSSVRNFANSLVRKMNQISINPMDYVDKTIVAYKNPGKNFPSPYITSAYSGMLFNFYCWFIGTLLQTNGASSVSIVYVYVNKEKESVR